MSRRNPMNDRYVMEKDKTGVSRKSVSNVKPKAKAGESTNYVSSTGSKKRSIFSKARQKTKEDEQHELNNLGPHARDRRLREEYNKWDVRRRRLVIVAFLLMFIALAYPFTVYEPTDETNTISMVLWFLPFIAIGFGIWISYAKQRPLGRILGVGYGSEDRDSQRSKKKDRREKQRHEYNKQEQKVAARVEEKEKRTQERDERRKANRAAEEERKQRYKAAGQAKSKKN